MDLDFWNLRGRDRSIHFIGIGGIGMSALARWFLAENWSVTGSDLAHSPITAELAEEGAMIKIGHKKGNIGRPAAVVASVAIPPNNPEYKEAERRKLPIYTYAQMAGEVARRYETVAVAGAHGKSTTTALTAIILERLDLDPTVIIGTKMHELHDRNFRAGKGRYLVLEADEYGRSFLNYSPAYLIVTNIDREHLDVYRNLMDIKKTFLQLFRQVLPGGALVLNADDPNLTTLQPDVERIAERNHLRIFWYSHDDESGRRVKEALQIPGQHNVSDATAAFTLATEVFELPEDKVLNAIGKFKGSWRRYEYKGEYKLDKITYQVFDDYAHHPTEIKATLSAFREKFPFTAITCVFQPHQGDRLRRLFKDFVKSFEDADALVLVPAYQVAGREKKETRYTAKALAAAIAKKDPKRSVMYLPQPEDLSRSLVREALEMSGLGHKKAIIVMMGAGTIIDYTPLLVEGQAARESKRAS